jgi:hypothetical protein
VRNANEIVVTSNKLRNDLACQISSGLELEVARGAAQWDTTGEQGSETKKR